MLEIPDKFNKNAPEVRALGSQAETGSWLIKYMCERLGIVSLEKTDLLDLGCGARFADSFLNLNLPVQRYTGIDIDKDLITFFQSNINDERFLFSHWDIANPLYNVDGIPLNSSLPLPISPYKFDVACMFSVITHQLPRDAEDIFSILKNYVKSDGFLFFSATIENDAGDYREIFPDQIALHSAYSMELMAKMLKRSGWKIVSFEKRAPNGLPIQDSFLCKHEFL